MPIYERRKMRKPIKGQRRKRRGTEPEDRNRNYPDLTQKTIKALI